MFVCSEVIYVYIVRWNYVAINPAELTVQKGDEVEIIEPGSKFKVFIDC